MIDTTASLLIVDSDPDFGRHLAADAMRRSYRADVVGSVSAALALIERDAYDAVLVDLMPAAESAFELRDRLKALTSDTELIVMSDQTSMAATIQWFDPEAFTFVRKTDTVQLFASLARSLERRSITSQNRRFVWELQTINEVGADLTRSLELDDVISVALQRLVSAMDAIGGSIRLRDGVTGIHEPQLVLGPPALRRVLTGGWPGLCPPCDLVVADGAAVIVDDFAEAGGGVGPGGEALPLRSAIGVPMMAGAQVIGTLSLASMMPRRFQAADQRLLATIAGQMVIAIQNAQLHHSIRRAKREWEQTFDAISDPIAVFNSRGELLRGNRALAAHLSLPVTAIARLSCRQVGFCGGSEGCRDCAVTRALAQQALRREVTLPDGQIFSVTTFRIGVPSEGPSVVQVAKNVTEEIRSARRLQHMSTELAATNERLVSAVEQLKSAQAQLVQAEKLSAIGQLVAGVAHELNNPLTSVIGYAQLVEEELREGPSSRPPMEVAQDLRRIADESERAARIVRNLLAFARRQGAAREPVDIVDVCSRVIALREYELRMGDVKLDTALPTGLPQVMGDGGQLQQVLLNLILNAERAMRGRPVRRLAIGAAYDDRTGSIALSVTDSGHGIDAADLSRIFDPFFTTRDVGEGTGLGLSICYGIVRDHGGQIDVESKAHVGTTFRVTLPARVDDRSVSHIEVLVAQTEQSEREFVAAALNGWGYHTVTATTLREAMAAYGRPTLTVAMIDRRLLDEDPPAWQELRAADRRRVPMVLTSRTHEPGAGRVGGEEAVAVLVPPIQLRALYAAVRASAKEYV
jgi:two-component system NtrC family sensor kinase